MPHVPHHGHMMAEKLMQKNGLERKTMIVELSEARQLAFQKCSG